MMQDGAGVSRCDPAPLLDHHLSFFHGWMVQAGIRAMCARGKATTCPLSEHRVVVRYVRVGEVWRVVARKNDAPRGKILQ